MKRFLIFAGVALVLLLLLAWAVSFYRKVQTKSFSPEEEVVFNQDKLKLRVFYNRPYKKGRQIFGGLVPFNKAWRTGANEATTFETNVDLMIEGQKLRRGKYTLWTLPGEETWKVIFNSETGQWGVDANGDANRNVEKDVLSVDVHALQQEREFEQFTISFEKVGEDVEMVLIWDKTLVSVPFSY